MKTQTSQTADQILSILKQMKGIIDNRKSFSPVPRDTVQRTAKKIPKYDKSDKYDHLDKKDNKIEKKVEILAIEIKDLKKRQDNLECQNKVLFQSIKQINFDKAQQIIGAGLINEKIRYDDRNIKQIGIESKSIQINVFLQKDYVMIPFQLYIYEFIMFFHYHFFSFFKQNKKIQIQMQMIRVDFSSLNDQMINDWLELDQMESLNNAQIFSNPPSEQKQRRKLIIEDSPMSSSRNTLFEGCYFKSQKKQEKIQFTAIKMMQDKVTQSDCPICIAELKNQSNILQFEPCGHMGCEDCMRKWIQEYKAQCPLCRRQCQDIYIIKNGDIRQKEKIFVQYAQEKGPEYYIDDEEDDVGCMVCLQDTTRYLLLVCDRCDRKYCHTFCDPALHGSLEIPDTLWYCLDCRRRRLIYNVSK